MKTKEATHTPKPWTNNDSYDSVLGADGEVVCHTFGAVDPVDKLNAILIAAAPEMLEALELMVHEFEKYATAPIDRLAISKAKAAIAKATGKEEGR